MLPPQHFDPPLIVPKNHDWRIRAEVDGGTSSVYAEASGYLAAVDLAATAAYAQGVLNIEQT